jgi:hypothetical protein
MTLANSERPTPTASRVPGPARVLVDLRRLRGRLARMALGRVLTADEYRWICLVADQVDDLIVAGQAVCGHVQDSRDVHRVRKRGPSGP